MTTPKRLWLWAAYAAFVIYGSLVPLEFRPMPWADAWAGFQRIPFLTLGVQSRADWVANGVLYVPLGALAAWACAGADPRRVGLPAVFCGVLTSWAIALVVEFVQQMFPPRTVSLNDLLAEGIGSVVGAAAAVGCVPALYRWHARSWRTQQPGVAQPLLRWLAPLYVAAYLLYSFFPFDLLLSRGELAEKLASGDVAWLVARGDEGASPFKVGALALVEGLATVPLGLMLAARGVRSPWRGAIAGAALGVVLEAAQIFIASGISQGLSVLMRALGVAAGVAWGASRHAPAVRRLRVWLGMYGSVLIALYIPLWIVAAGWGRGPVGGLALAEKAWRDLRLLPFYYHYYTTESLALVSLLSVALLAAPWAVWLWSRRLGAAAAGWFVALVTLPLEVSKLWLPKTHADPTNVLIAGVCAYALVRLLDALDAPPRAAGVGLGPTPSAARPVQPPSAPAPGSRPPVAHTPNLQPPSAPQLPERAPIAHDAIANEQRPQASRTAQPVGASNRAASRSRAEWATVAALPAVALAALSPTQPALLAALALVMAWTCARWPVLALAWVPLALPVLDLAPWAGRGFFDEFDWVCAATLPVAAWRLRARPWPLAQRGAAAALAFGAFALSLCAGALLTWGGVLTVEPNSFNSYSSPFSGLRIAKGLVWAWAFACVYRALLDAQGDRARVWRAGVALGLLGTVLVVLWERAAFVSLLDFGSEFRVTGLFSTMNKGGAYIECWLAVACAIVLVDLADRVSALRRVAVALLALGASYALVVTYSRNGYAALGAALLVLAVGAALRQRQRQQSALGAWAGVGAVAAAGVVLVLGSAFARERLDASTGDFATRRAHWQSALALRDAGGGSALWGAGVGRFPAWHAWLAADEPRAAAFGLAEQRGNLFLRLGTGRTVYVEQIAEAVAPREPLKLRLNVRSMTAERPQLTVHVCRKWTLNSADCVSTEVKGVSAAGTWQMHDTDLEGLPEPRNGAAAGLPVKLSLATPDRAPAVDVDNVSLLQGNRPLLQNGDFDNRLEHWSFATDFDPPWHIHSLWFGVLFDQGGLGLAALLLMLAVALRGGVQALSRGSVGGLAAFAGLAAFLVSASLNTLIDEPRFLWLLLVLCWMCVYHGGARRAAAARGRSAGPPAPKRAEGGSASGLEGLPDGAHDGVMPSGVRMHR